MYRRVHKPSADIIKFGLQKAIENGHARLVEMHREWF